LDDVLAKRGRSTTSSKQDGSGATLWGWKITTVEIREITPPKDILTRWPPDVAERSAGRR